MRDRRVYRGPLTDNSRWDRIALRDDDVIVVTPPKSGTTWMQTIVALLFSGDPDVAPDLSVKMPWIDICVRDLEDLAARLERMQQRRCFKSHTPLDGLPLDNEAHYLCVFRHPLDAHFSFRNHVRNISVPIFEQWYPAGEASSETFTRFLKGDAAGADCDAMPLAHLLQHYKAAKALSERPNVTLFHYADMQKDLPGTIGQVADLLQISHPGPVMEALIDAATFTNMKKNAARFAPGGGSGFYRSDADFFHKGRGGQWQAHLSSDELAAYDAVMEAELSADDRAWLERGSTGID